MDIEGKKVLVVGAGKSGISAVKLLLSRKAVPVLCDDNEELDCEAVYEKVQSRAFQIIHPSTDEQVLAQAELVVMSPGIATDTQFVRRFIDKGIPVWGEIELAYQLSKGSIIAITGTNGKTTTTALTGQIVEDYGYKTFVVGNIGIPYTDIANLTDESSMIVAEISSFQLETAREFSPKVSAILNITPDHLNRHHTMENYVAVKESITKNQTAEDYCVLNYMDPYTRAFQKTCPCQIIWFSSGDMVPSGYWYDGSSIWYVEGDSRTELIAMEETNLLGGHNAENIMAAIAMTRASKIPMESILESVKKFHAVEHRIEYVCTRNGVVYYNDSKGTNTDAAIKAIQAMNRPTVLIGGGYDKQSEYDEWIEAFKDKVKCLVLLGQTAEKIRECAAKHDFHNVVMAASMEEAVQICAREAKASDAVLLSPACASWGMFRDYEERGRIFKELVRKIPEEG